MIWYKPRTKGDAPPARAFHTATLVGSKIIVFGGNLEEKYYNDVFALDTCTAGIAAIVTNKHS